MDAVFSSQFPLLDPAFGVAVPYFSNFFIGEFGVGVIVAVTDPVFGIPVPRIVGAGA